MSTVLVVEDEMLVAHALAALLRTNGHDVTACVTSGEAAVASVESRPPDLVLMDIHLQGAVDGIEAARRIRARGDIPIVFLTAYADRDHLERAKLSGPHAYLLKPYADRELLTTIEVVANKHRLEAEVRTREQWLSTTLRSIGDGVIAVTPELRVEFLNAVAEQLTGWRSDEAKGRPVDEVLPLFSEATRQRVRLPIADAIRDRSVLHTGVGRAGVILLPRDGAERLIEDSVAPIIDGDRALGGVVVFRDVTEQRFIESRLALAERVSSLVTVTAGLGHEINNPLSATYANLDLVRESVLPQLRDQLERVAHADPGTLREAAAAAMASCGELADMMDDAMFGASRIRDIVGILSSFARPGQDRELVSLIDVIDSARKLAANELSLRGSVITDFRAAPLVLGHAGQLCQVVTQLLLNAAQSMDHLSTPGAIRIVVDVVEDRAVVEVSDLGRGIPPEIMVRIFEPFFTTKPVGLARGLGLAIVQALVSAHHGEVTVSSRVGSGTTVRVLLPRIEPARDARSGAALTVSTRRGRILLVDDEPVVLRALRRFIVRFHDVDIATSGAEALARIAADTYDLIISDLMMPGMTGAELHHALHERAPDLANQMLFTTGGAFTKETRDFVIEMGERVLAKPMTPEELHEIGRASCRERV